MKPLNSREHKRQELCNINSINVEVSDGIPTLHRAHTHTSGEILIGQ